MQFEDSIFEVIAELRNMDHPFVDKWEIEYAWRRKSQVLEAHPCAILLVLITSQPKLRFNKPQSLNKRHNLIIKLTSPMHHQKLKKTSPVANDVLPLPASANEATDAGNHGAQAMESEPVDAVPEDDAMIDIPMFDELIAVAGELLDAELSFGIDQPARASGSEDTTAIEADNRTFAETFDALGAERPAPRGAATANNNHIPIKTKPFDAECETCGNGAGQRVLGDPSAEDNAARMLAVLLAAA